MAHTYNPSTLGGWGGPIMKSRDQDHPGQHGEIPSLLKIQKSSWARWRVPVIPATQEAEAGELPEPRRWRLSWAEIAPLHSSLGNKSETPSQKKKNLDFANVISRMTIIITTRPLIVRHCSPSLHTLVYSTLHSSRHSSRPQLSDLELGARMISVCHLGHLVTM